MSAEVTIVCRGKTPRNYLLPVNYTIGRARGNDLVVEDPRASRNHALIRSLSGGKYYVVDLGSANGTFLNGRPVMVPAELKTGDEIQIADCVLRFSDPEGGKVANPITPSFSTTMATAVNASNETVSILVADIRNFSRLSELVPAHTLSSVVGSWFRDAGATIEQHGGVIDKFIGDAVMAYWLKGDKTRDRRFVAGPLHVARELHRLASSYHQRLLSLQIEHGFAIGCGIHTGQAIFGNIGNATRRDFTAIGDCVNVAFRLESLCKELNRPILVSKDLAQAADDSFVFEDLGSKRMKGKAEQVHVFALDVG